MLKFKLFVFGPIVFAAAGYAAAQSPMMQMQAPQGMEELKFDSQFNDMPQLTTQGGYRLIAIPKEADITDDGRKSLELFMNSCADCQEIPLIEGGPIPSVTPPPKNTVSEICKKYPGKYGCPEL